MIEIAAFLYDLERKISHDIENCRGEDRDFCMIAAVSTIFTKIVLLESGQKGVVFETALRNRFADQNYRDQNDHPQFVICATFFLRI